MPVAKLSFSCKALFFLLSTLLAGTFPLSAADLGVSFTSVNAVESERRLSLILQKPFDSLHTEAERTLWVRALCAMVSLRRLQGKEQAAYGLSLRCEGIACDSYAEGEEWAALRLWSCSYADRKAKKKAGFCSANSKAQKSPL